MESADRRLLEAAVQDPLERVVGTALRAVAYFVLNVDVPDYDLNAPNESGGCQGVHLVFSGGDVELDWDFREPAFRDEATAFSMAIRSASERGARLAQPAEQGEPAFARMDATQAEPWGSLVGQRLSAVTVWGWKLQNGKVSPQAVSFSFPRAEVAVAIGMSASVGGSPIIGDGDEVLVLDEERWSEYCRGQIPESVLVPLWRSR